MKCVKKLTKEKKAIVIRVSDRKAAMLVNQEKYAYCPKKVWKRHGRNYS